jgi:CheY-like chemotaxis protein
VPDFSPSRATAVLLVDDGDDIRLTTKWLLNSFGFTVDTARNAEEALALFDPRIHDAVVTDNSMPGITGAELAHIIKLRSPTTPVIMHTASPPEDRRCLDAVIQRPSHILMVKEAVERLLAAKAI